MQKLLAGKLHRNLMTSIIWTKSSSKFHKITYFMLKKSHLIKKHTF